MSITNKKVVIEHARQLLNMKVEYLKEKKSPPNGRWGSHTSRNGWTGRIVEVDILEKRFTVKWAEARMPQSYQIAALANVYESDAFGEERILEMSHYDGYIYAKPAEEFDHDEPEIRIEVNIMQEPFIINYKPDNLPPRSEMVYGENMAESRATTLARQYKVKVTVFKSHKSFEIEDAPVRVKTL